MSIANRMDYLEEVYNAHEGNIHVIFNKYDLDSEDFDYLNDLKAYNNGSQNWAEIEDEWDNWHNEQAF